MGEKVKLVLFSKRKKEPQLELRMRMARNLHGSSEPQRAVGSWKMLGHRWQKKRNRWGRRNPFQKKDN